MIRTKILNYINLAYSAFQTIYNNLKIKYKNNIKIIILKFKGSIVTTCSLELKY